MVDKYIFSHPNESHFASHPDDSFIRCYLQLFWNPIENQIYSDVKVFAASAKGFMPIDKRIDFNLYDDSEISLTSSSWGWWAKLINRVDYRRFKAILWKKFGKNNEFFAHYFRKKELDA